jgi:hypothetical protein
MTERDQRRDTERLPEEAGRQLLARASELEAKRGAELSVDELRAAAQEAGIAADAFDQALAELRDRDPGAAAPSKTISTRRRVVAQLWFWLIALIAAAVVFLLVQFLVPAT